MSPVPTVLGFEQQIFEGSSDGPSAPMTVTISTVTAAVRTNHEKPQVNNGAKSATKHPEPLSILLPNTATPT